MVEEQSFRHIWLYAKGWYKRGNLMEDLRILVGHHTALKLAHVTDSDVLTVLCDIAVPYLVTEGNVVYRMREFFRDLIQVTQHKKRPLTIEDIVIKLLGVLQGVRTKRGDEVIINLGELDFNLLPEAER